jgi:hypothetical protein
MSHDELLDKIDFKIMVAAHTDSWNIVRVIAEMHSYKQNERHKKGNSGLRKRCVECGFAYPCPTIGAIEKELG